MRSIICILALWTISAQATAEPVPFDSPRWRLESLPTGQARVVEHMGRQALALHRGVAMLGDANFDTGVIEYDIAMTPERGFHGVLFRGQDESNYEHFYLRPHQSGNPDANQYTPVFNGATGWQIYYGADYSAPTRYRFNEWMHVRIEVAADSARVFIDSETPVLVIHDLKRDRSAGFLALDANLSLIYLSNFSYQAATQADAPPASPPAAPAGLVQAWRVSEAMTEAEAYAAAARNRLDGLLWTQLVAETNGIANLARVGVRTQDRLTVLARVQVRSDRARTVLMRFGFSDKVRLFVNGVPLYDGEDRQGSRDYRFLGTVGLWDAAHLALRRGNNEVVLAVTEPLGSGGWAAMAAFDDMTGSTLVE